MRSAPLIPNFLSYVLSFTYVGIYWNNHHHMLLTLRGSDRGDSLGQSPFLVLALIVSRPPRPWIGENHLAAAPSALYGVVLLMAAIAYRILQQVMIAAQGPDSLLKKAVGRDWKGKSIANRLLDRHRRRISVRLRWLKRCICWWRCSGSCRTAVLNTYWFANRHPALELHQSSRLCDASPLQGVKKAGIWQVRVFIGTILSCSMSS